jgi:hypothetical protein
LDGVLIPTALLPVIASGVILVLGATASFAAFPPGTLSFPTRVASCFALGYAVISLLGTGLVIVHLMKPWVFLACLVGLTLALGVRVWPSVRLSARLPRRPPSELGFLFLGGAVLVALAVARAHVPVNAGAGGWRYWADGLEIAAVGHEPAQTLQWGVLTSPAISKLGANAYNAALSFPLGGHPFSAMAASLWLSAIGFGAGLWALSWELGLRATAPLVPLACLASHVWPGGVVFDDAIVSKLRFFQDEDAGRMCAVVAVALAIPVVRGRGGWRRGATCGVLLAAAGLTHLIPAIIAVIVLVAYAIALGLARASLVAAIRRTAIILAVAASIVLLTLAASGGNIGFGGASGGGYRLAPGGADPTLALLGRHAPPRHKSSSRLYTSPTPLARHYVESALGVSSFTTTTVALLVVCAFAFVIAVAIGESPERIAAVASVAAIAVIYLVGVLFSYRYSYYIQATFPDRRLFEYGSVLVVILLAAGANAVLRRSASYDHRAPVVGGVVLILTIVGVVGWGGLGGGVAGGRPHDGYIEAARLVTPCNSRILVPTTTRGSFQSLTGRASLREGLMAFLRPDLLAHSLTIEREGGTFFRSPGEHGSFLVRNHVDYVLAPTAMEGRLSHLVTLQRTAAVDGIAVYRVASAFDPGAPRPDAAPGYVCRSGALE